MPHRSISQSIESVASLNGRPPGLQEKINEHLKMS
jgi:hypothetical protein